MYIFLLFNFFINNKYYDKKFNFENNNITILDKKYLGYDMRNIKFNDGNTTIIHINNEKKNFLNILLRNNLSDKYKLNFIKENNLLEREEYIVNIFSGGLYNNSFFNP